MAFCAAQSAAQKPHGLENNSRMPFSNKTALVALDIGVFIVAVASAGRIGMATNINEWVWAIGIAIYTILAAYAMISAICMFMDVKFISRANQGLFVAFIIANLVESIYNFSNPNAQALGFANVFFMVFVGPVGLFVNIKYIREIASVGEKTCEMERAKADQIK